MTTSTDWLHLAAHSADLALNAAQLEQLNANSEMLAQLLSYESEKKRAAQSEDDLRQLVFEQECSVREAQTLMPSSPKQAYLAARLIVSKSRAAGIDPGRFREFVDKDRTLAYLHSEEELLCRSDAALPRDEILAIDTALRLMRERPDLERLVAGTHAYEQAAAVEPRWKNKVDHDAIWLQTYTGIAVGLYAVALLVIVLAFTIPSASDPTGVVLAAIVAGLIATALVVFPRSAMKRSLLRLYAERDLLWEHRPPESEMDRLRSKFPSRSSSAEYQALLAERDEQVVRFLT